MIVKMLSIIGFVAAIVWWQFRDLAQEKKREVQLQAAPETELTSNPELPQVKSFFAIK